MIESPLLEELGGPGTPQAIPKGCLWRPGPEQGRTQRPYLDWRRDSWFRTGPDENDKDFLALASWCAGSAIKRPCKPVPVTYAPGAHGPDARR